ncbi:hypothetical protein DRQ18_06455 [bacterium]|nr:MAG: hypothetical protein DRQ18_06455 [bacterium]
MEGLRIEKKKIRVVLFLRDGEKRTGHVFLSPSSRYHEGRETVLEFFNDENSFFAFGTEEGVEFLNKKHVLMVEVEDVQEERFCFCPGSRMEKVKIVMVDGREIEGEIGIERVPYRMRLLDFLNLSETFFPVKTQKGIFIVNREHIKGVHPWQK